MSSKSATAVGAISIALWSTLALLTVRAGPLPPFEKLSLCFAVAFTLGMVVLAARGRTMLVQLSQPLGAWLLSFGGIFLYHALYFYALGVAPPAPVNLLNYLWPLFVLLGATLGGQRPRAGHIAGALLGLAGTAILLAGGTRFGTATNMTWLGYGAATTGAVVWAGYSTMNRHFAGVPSTMLVGVCGAVAIAGLLCHAALEPWIMPAPAEWIAIILLGIGPTGLAFMAWDHATKHGNLRMLGVLSYLVPLLSTLLLVLDGEAPANGQLAVAALLIVGGAVVASMPARPR